MTTKREDVELMPESEFDFELFKKQFMFVAKTKFCACEYFMHQIQKSKDLNEFREIIRRNGEGIAEEIGVDLDDDSLCGNCASLERDVYRLKDIVSGYEPLNKSIADQFKLEAYVKHKDKFTFLEFEELMQNGVKQHC